METLELMPIRVRITSILKKAIYSGEYKSGDELSLTDVAAHLGVSRTPVREAFQALAADGLITLRMNKGAIVNPIDRKFVQDHFEMRCLLETEAAARAARGGMETADLLRRLLSLRERVDTVDPEEYRALNQALHLAIWTASGNERMKSCLLELWNGPSTGSGPHAEREHYRLSTDEHIRILEAIRDRNPDAAAAGMRQHINRSMQNILENYPAEQAKEGKQ